MNRTDAKPSQSGPGTGRDRSAGHAGPVLGRRVSAWAHSWRLDEELASGVDPQSEAALMLRAEHLRSRHLREQLAAGLRDVVERACRPQHLGSVAPVARVSVLANRDLLYSVADRLEAEPPAEVRGIAAVRMLLVDDASPLWMRTEGDELHDALVAAAEGLGG